MSKMEAKLEGMVHQLSSFNPRSYSGHKRPMLPVHPATCALPPANLSLVRGNLGTGLRGSVAACTACGSRSSGGGDDGSPSSAAVVASGTRPSACAGPSGMSNVDSSDDGPVSPRAALASYLLPPPLPRGLCLQRASLSSGTFPCFGRSDSARSRSNSAPEGPVGRESAAEAAPAAVNRPRRPSARNPHGLPMSQRVAALQIRFPT